jgi:hypothetical protein
MRLDPSVTRVTVNDMAAPAPTGPIIEVDVATTPGNIGPVRPDTRRAWARDVDQLDLEGVAIVTAMVTARRRALEGPLPDRRAELEAIDRFAHAQDAASLPRRSRGRPRRADIDRAALIDALARHQGSIRAAARSLRLPRNTVARHSARLPKWTWVYGPELLQDHAKRLHDSGVVPEVAKARGYRSVARPGAPDRAGMLVPLWTVHGRRAWSQIRLDTARSHAHRYENARDARPMVDCSPAARPRVLDQEFPLYVTESPRKADAAVSCGLACVDFPGIRMLCLHDETWDYIGVRDRDVRIVFDGDAGDKPDVGAAERRLAEFLTGKGAHVVVYRLPAHQGLDDYLAGGSRIDALPKVTLSTTVPRVAWRPQSP